MKTITNSLFFIVSLIVISFISKTAFSQTGWQQVTSPQPNQDLYGIYFKDINTGLCDIYKTTNGTQSWYQPTMIGGGYSMMFPDPNTGYISSIGTVFKTTNLGENWEQQTPPTSAILYGIHFPNVNTGYACGAIAKIVKTTNNGINWELLTSPVSSSYYLRGIFFVNSNTGFVAGYTTNNNPSVILKTIDGGYNWDVQNFVEHTGFSSIFFVNSINGIALGITCVKTTDGGTIWSSKTLPYTGFFYCLYFPSVNTGFAAGFGGVIIKTTNGGETWFRQTSNITSSLRSIYFINDNTGYVCGDEGVVLKTTDGGGPPIGITPISSKVPQNYALYQNYPNPFNPSTHTRYDISQSGYVKLVVYDMLGRQVAVLVNEQLKPGEYEAAWTPANLPSGVYFCRLVVSGAGPLTAEGWSETKKMLMIK